MNAHSWFTRSLPVSSSPGRTMLEVFDRHHGSWLDALAGRLREGRSPPSPDEVARLTVSTLLHDPLLVRLFGRIGVMIDGNVSPEAGHRFRFRRTARIAETALALESRRSGLTSAQAAKWLAWFEACTAGIAPLARTPRMDAGAFDEPSLTALHLDLESELQYIAVTMLLSR